MFQALQNALGITLTLTLALALTLTLSPTLTQALQNALGSSASHAELFTCTVRLAAPSASPHP